MPKKDKQFHTAMDDELKERIKTSAIKLRISMANFIRIACEEKLAKEETN